MSWGKLTVAVAALAFLTNPASAVSGDHSPKVDTSQPTVVIYPMTSQTAGEQGTVVVRVYVLESGKPVRVNIGQSSGFSDLDAAAMQTAFNWHYVPAIVNGEPTDDWAVVRVDYRLPSQTASK